MCSRAAIGNLAAIQRGAAATVDELDGIGFSCVHVIRESNAIHIAAQTRSPDIRIVDPSCPREDICEIERKIESRRRNHGRAAPDARPEDNHPFFSNHAGRTALCPEMSLAPAAVHKPRPGLWTGGTSIRPMS